MDIRKFYEIKGYLMLLSTIYCQMTPPIVGEFEFKIVNDENDLNDGFKKIINKNWSDFGCNERYLDFDLNNFIFEFLQCADWRNSLNENLEFWIEHIINKTDSPNLYGRNFIRDEFMGLFDKFIDGAKVECYQLENRHNAFLKDNFSYLRNDIYFFKIEGNIFILSFGLDD